jgi:hypothetical protein
MSESADHDLWLRYVDWSATRINRRLLDLSVDELWALANDRSPTPSPDSTAVPADLLPSQSSPIELLQLVRKATLSIARELNLPPFAVWKEAYARDPDAYERDISGI